MPYQGDFKYADYDYGQPDSEKRGLHIRNRSGDSRVARLAAAFAILTLGFGALLAIPGVRDGLDRTTSLADVAFGQEFFEIRACFTGHIDLAELHAHESMEGVETLELTMVSLTRSKGEVSSQTRSIDVRDIDWSKPPVLPRISMIPQADDDQLNPSIASQCEISLVAIRP